MGSTFLLKIYDYENKRMSGKLFDVERNRHYDYSNITQILMLIDGILKEHLQGVLRKDEVYTSAYKEGNFELISGEKSWLTSKMRVFRTFKLNICFTSFSTWQGELWCVDTGSHSAFRSVLELMMLMDAELEAASAEQLRAEA